MDIVTAITLIGTALGTIGLVYTFLRNFKTDINEHIDKIEKNLILQGQRTDHLYQICVELLKENRNEFGGKK
jgi:hypothetical protein